MMSLKKLDAAPPLLATPATIPPIADDPRYAKVAQRLDRFESARRAAEERRRQAVLALAADGAGASASALTADEIAGGRRIPSGATAAGEIAAADAELLKLRPALAVAADALDEVKGELSYEICRRHSELNKAAHRKMLQAMIAFAEAYNALAGLHAELLGGGYSVNFSAIPWQIPANPLPVVGMYAERIDGPIEVLRRFIEEKLP